MKESEKDNSEKMLKLLEPDWLAEPGGICSKCGKPYDLIHFDQNEGSISFAVELCEGCLSDYRRWVYILRELWDEERSERQ